MVGLFFVAGQFVFLAPDEAYGQSNGSGTKAAGDTILAFTSDVHNRTNDVSADRLASWIDEIQGEYGAIDAMGFCGDMADAGDGTNYWRNAKAVMDTVDSKGVEGVYTTGNHEFNPGGAVYDMENGTLTSAKGQSVVDRFTVGDLGKEGDNYRIFCLGSIGTTQEYIYDHGVKMHNYLMHVDNDKPIIVITHFPLHFCVGHNWGDRTTGYATNAIDTLNSAATNNTPDDPSDDRTIIFLWGHNHSESDPYYDQIYTPGDKIQITSDSQSEREIKFYYGAAGCMSDSEYGGSSGGSASVKGKGLVLQIKADDSIGFGYCNAEGVDVTENGDYPKIELQDEPVTGLNFTRKSLTVKAGKNGKLTAKFAPMNAANKNLTWESSDEDIATVTPEETGTSAKVHGVSEGTVDITATSEDGGFTATAEVTVKGEDPEQYRVIQFGNYALSSRATFDKMTTDSGYEYHGLEAVKYASGDAAPYYILWKIEPADGVENGYYIKSHDGKYLNATYTSNGTGNTGILAVNDTKDVWTVESGLDSWESSSSKLRSTNAEKYAAATQSDNGDTYFFTVRSRDSSGTYNDSRLLTPEVVTEPVEPKGVTIEPAELSVEVGKSTVLKETVFPDEADDKTVTWSSSDEDIATVSGTGRVKGIAEGTAVITCTTNDGGKTATSNVTVTERTPTSSGYVIKIGDLAMSTELTDDVYISPINDSYHYTGLDGVEYDSNTTPDKTLLWEIEETDGGYYIRSLDGRYLNSTYLDNDMGGKTGTLKLDETKDVWTITGSLDDWVVNGSTLTSSNSGKAITHEELSANDVPINVFTVRTTGDLTTAVERHYHLWGELGYTWNDDNTKVTAKRVCSVCNDEETETVDAAGEVTTPATCTAMGETTYTSAAFENKAFAVQEKTEEDVPVLGHDWGAWTKLDGSQHQRVCKRDASHIEKSKHTWNSGKVTKKPTETTKGVKTYTCTACGATKSETIPATGYKPGEDPNQTGEDGTAVGPGASAAAAEAAITKMKNDKDPAGAVFAKLKFKSPKQTKNSIKLNWMKVSKAKKYVIYGNKCGKTTKMKKLATVTGKTKAFKKVAGKKVKKGTYYKFIIVALDKKNNVASTSKLIHVAAKDGKVGNPKSVMVKKVIITKAKKLKKGKKLSLKATAVPQSKKLKVRKHVAVRYETTNKKIATVTAKGVVTAKKKGTCYVYAYAQNGVFKKIKVVVK
ncbi:MAG: Ig-like domain-containing protein [Firmicutes bacterium]|nr:Ig-like domain-containing protein [Bacillota bacterium]